MAKLKFNTFHEFHEYARRAKQERERNASYFLFRPEITTAEVCHNAKSRLCEKCHEPECELAGWKEAAEH